MPLCAVRPGTKRSTTRLLACFAVFAALAAGLPEEACADPPARVGRVSFLSGTVAFFADPDEGWRPAVINFPVTSENSIWTERNARSEVQIGATAIGVDQDTVLDFQRVTDAATLAYLQRGAMSVRMHDADARDVYRIATPQAQFTLSANGVYRIEADDGSGETSITVFQGRARADVQGATTRVDAGRAFVVSADGRAAFADIGLTDFDDWNRAREERGAIAAADSAAYVSSAMTGAEDLDRYGQWTDTPDYGAVWYPAFVATGWVPYRFGHWAWVRPWGWTWIDDAAWGFAPFHYGRWVQVHDRWGWWPGGLVRRPAYAPALVVWIGTPGGAGPGVGWCPLGPRETFYPRYTNNAAYIRNVNNFGAGRPLPPRTEAAYINRRPGATFVPANVFASAGPVASNHVRPSTDSVAALPATQNPSFLPQREPAVPGLRGRGPALNAPAATVPSVDRAPERRAGQYPGNAVAPTIESGSEVRAGRDRAPYHAPGQPRLAKPLQVPLPSGAAPPATAGAPFPSTPQMPPATAPVPSVRSHPVPQYQIDETPVRPVPAPRAPTANPRPVPLAVPGPQGAEPAQPRYRVPAPASAPQHVPQPQQVTPHAPLPAQPAQASPQGPAQAQPRGDERDQPPRGRER